MKHFSCVVSLVLKIFARCKKHVSYFSSVYLHLIKIYPYTISLASKLLKCDQFFVIFNFLTNVKIDFHISHRQKHPVKYIWYFETPLFILYKTSCPISSVYGPILAYYKQLQDTVLFGLKPLSNFQFRLLLYLLHFKEQQLCIKNV